MAVKGHVMGRPTAHVTRMVFLALHYANVQTVETFLTTGSFLKRTCEANVHGIITFMTEYVDIQYHDNYIQIIYSPGSMLIILLLRLIVLKLGL